MKFVSFLMLSIFLFIPLSFAARVTTFVAPDNSYEAFKIFLDTTYKDLSLVTYTFTSPQLMADLIEAKQKRSLNIILLVEKSPIGGFSETSKKIFCNFEKNGINVYLYNGTGFLHAKYAINELSVLISTENFADDGFPIDKDRNRGWGAIVEDPSTVTDFSAIFRNDLQTSVKFNCNLADYKISLNDKEIKSNTFKIKVYNDQKVKPLFAPNNAVDSVLTLINSTQNSLYIEQFYIYTNWTKGEKNPFLEAAISKSKNADVKILMDGSWYNVDKNDPNSNFYTNNYIISLNNSNLKSKIINLNKLGFEKMHTKGIIVDNNSVLISSINWNKASPTKNREAGVIISGEAAKYYAEVFDYDWNDGIIADLEATKSNQLTGQSTATRNSPDPIITAISIILILIGTFVAIKFMGRMKRRYGEE